MIQLKACPKCQGDFYVTEDSFGKFLNCFQCGYIKDLELPVADAQHQADAEAQVDNQASASATAGECHGIAA
tara:strand:- start:560 stop:775 length:216 start_codon:yes stop_codon:yes gene_type:complete